MKITGEWWIVSPLRGRGFEREKINLRRFEMFSFLKKINWTRNYGDWSIWLIPLSLAVVFTDLGFTLRGYYTDVSVMLQLPVVPAVVLSFTLMGVVFFLGYIIFRRWCVWTGISLRHVCSCSEESVSSEEE